MGISHNESKSQQAVIKWWAYAWKVLRAPCEEVLYAIPNGGSRRIVEAVIMKREGVRKGVADLFLSVPKGGFAGFYIEMKTQTGVIRTEQKQFLLTASKLKYCVAVCRSAEEAVEQITSYMRQPDTKLTCEDA